MMSNPKKIVIVAATPLTIHFFLKPHLIALAKSYEVTLMVNLRNDSYLPELNLPIQIIDIPIARKIAPLSDLRCLLRLMYLFHQHKYDLLITVVPKAGLLGMLAGAFSGIPHRLHIFQGEVWANLRGIKRIVLSFCDWITANLATNLLAVSHSERKFLIDSHVVTAKKINVLGGGSIGGVDLKRFRPNRVLREEMRIQLGIPQDARVVIFIGRLVADKGIHELLQAYRLTLPAYPDLRLLLVGPDEDGEMARIDWDMDRSQVRQIPYTTEPERYLAAADFLCLPSHREGFGVVIIEAAAMGLPSIASNIYGINDAVMDQVTGLLFKCGDVDDLQRCIQALLANQILRESLGVKARQNVEQNFSNQEVVGNYLDYIHQIMQAQDAT
jgi:glycosyltransferase involved in cell wall biosynthesis